MNHLNRILPLLLALALLLPGKLQAQQVFTEGTITYAVSIGAVSGDAGFTEHAGTYTLTIKGHQLRRELKMNNGFQSIIIQNSNIRTSYSLKDGLGQKFAIELDAADGEERRKPFSGFSLQSEEGKSTIAGQECRKAAITYKDGSRSEVYCATGWTTSDSTIFERYPGIGPLPLAFEYRNEEGIVMHFHAERLEAKPVENAVFRIPPGYKIISSTEYKQLKR